MTFDELKKMFPDATPETWHQHKNGGGWVENTATVADSAYVGPDAKVCGNALVCGYALVCGNALVCGEARVCDDALVYDSEPQNSPTLDHSPKAECITGPHLLLLKAQVLREMRSYFDESQGMDPQYHNYLEGLESATIEAIGDAETLDYYLRESRRITLKEWMDSLDWRHCTMDKK